MKMNIIKKSFITLLVFVSASCTNLELEPVSFITNANFWQSEDDVSGVVNGMYFQLRDVARYDLFVLGEGRGEILSGGLIGTGGYDLYYDNTLTPENVTITWKDLYKIVNTTNLILKYAPGIEFTSESDKNNYLAQAYTMRAFVYFVLTKTWGDLVIHTDPIESSDANVVQKERSSQADVFALIKDDLDKAISLFPDNSFTTGRNYWTKAAANALKADVYLWTGKRLNGGASDFNAALDALNEVKKADVELLPEFADVFNYENKGNKEIVMSIRFEPLEQGMNYFSSMWVKTDLVPPTVDQETKDLLGVFSAGQGIMRPSTLYKEQYSEGDTRRDGTMFDVYEYPDGVKTYYSTVVMKGIGVVSTGRRDFVSDVILYRYSDILLMIAEAKNALGEDPAAEINLVRARAFKDNYDSNKFISGSKEFNDEAILKERLLELAFEGKRWWDLVRFNQALNLVPSLQDKVGKDYMLLFPIKNSVLSLEPKVDQNPGWGI